MFDGFDEFDITTTETQIHGRVGGSGPPVLLLHGMPETHLMWHRVAPRLVEHFTVVATDLRGYGASGTPASTPDHQPYTMRALARDQVEVMARLGYDRFDLVGHDRGARCAYRLAIDHPDAVGHLTVLDIVPTGEAFRLADAEFSLGFWIWTFLAAPAPVPERFIAGAPEVIVDHMLDALSEVPDSFPADVRAQYVAQFEDMSHIHAICEQYRAAATLDRANDDADSEGHPIKCPVLALWSERGAVAEWYEPLDIWREWAGDVRGGPLPSGHFIPEELPEQLADAIVAFSGAPDAGPSNDGR
jgi:haloacetate dehalogenase